MPANNRGVSGVTLTQFFTAVLKGLGAPVTQNNLTKLGAIARMEGHGGNYNPFNYVNGPGTNFNSVGVKNYPDVQTGIAQTIRLLNQGNTRGIRDSLMSNGAYQGWLGAATRFYQSWGGPPVRTTQNNALTYLNSTVDGPPVPQHVVGTLGSSATAEGGTRVSDFFNWQAQPRSLAQSGQYNSLSPHLAQFRDWLIGSYGGSDLGGHVDRAVRGGSAPSSHAFGAATDWGYSDRAKADAAINYVVANAQRLGIQAVHDYDRMRVWHAGRGWKDAPRGSHGGLMRPGTHHLHFEVNQANWGTPFSTSGSSPAGASGASGTSQGGQVSDSYSSTPSPESAFNSYLARQTPQRAQQVIEELRTNHANGLGAWASYLPSAPAEVRDYVGYLASLPGDRLNESLAGLSPSTADVAPVDPAQQSELNDLLQTFGVNYPNAPRPTPALLAFLRGIGLNMETAEDVQRRAIQRIGAATTDAMAEIDTNAGRTKTNTTTDLVRRGVLSSGEANTRYARNAQDEASARSDVTRADVSAREDSEQALKQARDMSRQQALERLINAEQEQSTQAAASRAQEDAFRRQTAAQDAAWQREQEQQNRNIAAQEELIRNYGNQGVVV